MTTDFDVAICGNYLIDNEDAVFVPYSHDHALASVTFSVAFAEAFHQEAISAVEAAHDLWRNELPAKRPSKNVIIGHSNDGNMRFEQNPGVEFAYLRPDGTQAWHLAVTGNEVLIECNRYTRWEKIWGSTESIFQNVLKTLMSRSIKSPVISIGLSVQDLFFWEGDLANYDLSQLLQRSPIIADVCFEKGSVWHSHTAWFEDYDNSSTNLVNFNLTASKNMGAALARNMAAQVEVRNEQDFRFTAKPRNLSTFAENDFEELSAVMSRMHTRNKELLSTVLVGQMAARIGLA